MQASTLTFFLTCPFEQLTKISTCPTQSFSCPNKLIQIIKTREKLSAICVKCFGYCLANIISPVIIILTDIMTSLIDKLIYI